jgi:hypothetical protein
MDVFRSTVSRIRIGDTVAVEVSRTGGPFRASVVVTVQQRPTVHLEPIAGVTERRLALRRAWLAATP